MSYETEKSRVAVKAIESLTPAPKGEESFKPQKDNITFSLGTCSPSPTHFQSINTLTYTNKTQLPPSHKKKQSHTQPHSPQNSSSNLNSPLSKLKPNELHINNTTIAQYYSIYANRSPSNSPFKSRSNSRSQSPPSQSPTNPLLTNHNAFKQRARSSQESISPNNHNKSLFPSLPVYDGSGGNTKEDVAENYKMKSNFILGSKKYNEDEWRSTNQVSNQTYNKLGTLSANKRFRNTTPQRNVFSTCNSNSLFLNRIYDF